jgi:hypothetical protein
MPSSSSLDGISMPTRPSLSSIKQASTSAFNKAQLMVGLKSEEDLEAQRQQQQEQDSERSSRSFVDEAVDLLCPELTFQQRLIGFASCFALGYLITCMSFKFFVELIEVKTKMMMSPEARIETY